MSNYNDVVLGKGYNFPIQIDSSTGRPPIYSDIELIRRSITTVLAWPVGLRFFLGEFGSKLDELLEDPNDSIMLGLVKHYIVEAISTWETRIKDLEVPQIIQKNDRIDITLQYYIISTAQVDSFVFPFYLPNNIKY